MKDETGSDPQQVTGKENPFAKLAARAMAQEMDRFIERLPEILPPILAASEGRIAGEITSAIMPQLKRIELATLAVEAAQRTAREEHAKLRDEFDDEKRDTGTWRLEFEERLSAVERLLGMPRDTIQSPPHDG